MLKSSRLLILLFLFSSTNFSTHAEERKEYAMINITAGQIGLQEELDGPQRYGLEYHFKLFTGLWGIHLIPTIGAIKSHNGASFFTVILSMTFT